LITLVEVLSGKNIKEKWAQNPKLKHHKINNCYIALKFLQEEIKMPNITISAEDIVNADRMNLVLGFCWVLLRFFQSIGDGHEKQANALEIGLLKWCQDTLAGYSDIKIADGFKSESFHNGKVLLALITEYDKNSNAYSKYNPEDKVHNCVSALQLGESFVGIPGDIIDPNELADGSISDSNMVLYLSLMYNAYKEKYQGQTKESILKRIEELEARLKALIIENEDLKSKKGDVELSLKDLSKKLDFVTEEKQTLLVSKEQKETEFGTLKESYSKEKHDLEKSVSELEANIALLKSASGENQHHLESAKDQMKKERDAIKDELQKTKDKLNKEKEELQHEQEELISNVKKAQKAREELEEKMKQKQEENSRTIHLIRKHLLQHVKDMHVWKVFLDQDKEQYEADDLHVVMEPELESLPFSQQMSTLDKAISEENSKLDELLQHRLEEAKKEEKAAAAAKVDQSKDKKKKKDPIKK